MWMAHVAMVNVLATRIIAQIDCTVQTLDENPFDLIQADGIVGAILQPGCARRLVVADLRALRSADRAICYGLRHARTRHSGRSNQRGTSGPLAGCSGLSDVWPPSHS
jgi:hypothetical protein